MKALKMWIVAIAVLTATSVLAGSVQKVLIRVDGVACPFCAYGLEKKLKRIDGVDKLDILINEGLVVLYLEEGATVDEALLRRKVEEAGFTPRNITAKIELDIAGMTCSDCREQVKEALSSLDCVDEVTVDPDSERADIVCSDPSVDPAIFVAAVSGLGFDATLRQP